MYNGHWCQLLNFLLFSDLWQVVYLGETVLLHPGLESTQGYLIYFPLTSPSLQL